AMPSARRSVARWSCSCAWSCPCTVTKLYLVGQRSELLEPVDLEQRREQPSPERGEDDRDGAADDDRRHGAEQRGRDARLERTELVRRRDEHHLDRVHPPAQLVRRG